MIKAVISDLFGVLIGRGFDETYRMAGGDPIKDKEFLHDVLTRSSSGQINTEEFIAIFCKKLNTTPEEFKRAVTESEQPNKELFTLLKNLRPTYKTALLSNANKGVLERKVAPEVYDGCFDEVVVSAEVGFIKPQQEIYMYTAEKLGVEPKECVFIDDIGEYVSAAEAIGMTGIVYRDFESLKNQLEKILANTDS